VSRLISVNVGLPRDVSWHGATVYTAVWRSPVPDRRMVRRLNIERRRFFRNERSRQLGAVAERYPLSDSRIYETSFSEA
jgi:hypothetical protein